MEENKKVENEKKEDEHVVFIDRLVDFHIQKDKNSDNKIKKDNKNKWFRRINTCIFMFFWYNRQVIKGMIWWLRKLPEMLLKKLMIKLKN